MFISSQARKASAVPRTELWCDAGCAEMAEGENANDVKTLALAMRWTLLPRSVKWANEGISVRHLCPTCYASFAKESLGVP